MGGMGSLGHRERVGGFVALGSLVIAMLLLFFPTGARAQSRGGRAFRSLEVREIPDGWILDLRFEISLRYLQHSPRGHGTMLRIQVDQLDLSGAFEPDSPRELLPIPAGTDAPLVEVAFDSSNPDERLVEILFSGDFEFTVSQGEDLRSLRIRVEREGAVRPKAALPPEGTAAPTGDVDPKAAELLERAQLAIRDGQLDLAIALLTRVLESAATPGVGGARRRALELLGVTHERRGQIAHARAEYEQFLSEYPAGEDADRVRQRLDALITADAAPTPELRDVPPSARKAAAQRARKKGSLSPEVFGSLAVTYFRTESIDETAGATFLRSDVLNDANVTGRLTWGDWQFRGDFAGTYDVDLSDTGRSDDRRFSRLRLQAENRERGLELTVGRQRRSDGGVLGRFDGASGRIRVWDGISLSTVVGMPVASTSDSRPNTDSVFAGAAVDFSDLWIEGLRAQIYGIGQNTFGLTDRAAIGGEVRYSNPKGYSFAYFDYDVYFKVLNTAILSGTWFARPDTDFRLLVERRNSPVVTMQLALQGQISPDLGALQDRRSTSEIRQLALDRLLPIWTGSAGVTHRPSQKYQLSGDVTVTYLGETKTNADVPGTEAVGPDVATTVQLLVNDWLLEGGVGSVAVRYYEGENTRALAVSGYSRFRFVKQVRVSPRLRWEWRDSVVQGGRSSLRPSLEADWRIGPVLLSAEGGIEWVEPLPGSDDTRQSTYFVQAGGRWEF